MNHLVVNKNRKLEQQLALGYALQDKGKVDEAIAKYNGVLKVDSKNLLARLNKSVCLLKKGQMNEALPELHDLYLENPDNLKIIKLCGAGYARAGHNEIALKFLKRALQIEPDEYETWIDITLVCASLQMHRESIYYATQALSLNPTDSRGHNNLGGALLAHGKVNEAIMCFETCLMLEPNNFTALSNLATACQNSGQPQRAKELYERLLQTPGLLLSQKNEVLYKLSFSNLSLGNLEKGWELYDYGLQVIDSRARIPRRKFSKPMWQGQKQTEKTLLIWREQGLGDELRFFGLVSETIPFFKKVIIECDARLVKLLQHAFPTAEVRQQMFITKADGCYSLYEDFDFHIPVGSLMRFFRKDLKDFERAKPYLIADEDLRADFRNRLKTISDKPKIGVSWRSGVVNAERSAYYTPVTEWGDIFSKNQYEFINLQYDLNPSELEAAEKAFGLQIHNLSDVDLKNDLDSVVALMAELDLVISAPTSVCSLAEAVGTPVKFFYPGGWILLGTNQYLWYPNTDVYVFDKSEGIGYALKNIANDLN